MNDKIKQEDELQKLRSKWHTILFGTGCCKVTEISCEQWGEMLDEFETEREKAIQKCSEEFEKEILELKNDNSFKDNRIEKQDELIIFWQDKHQKIIEKIKKLQIWDRKNIPCDDTEVIRYDDLQQLLSEIDKKEMVE